MEIHTITHARNPTVRAKCRHNATEDFKIIEAGTASGIKLKAECSIPHLTVEVSLSPKETRQLIDALLKK